LANGCSVCYFLDWEEVARFLVGFWISSFELDDEPMGRRISDLCHGILGNFKKTGPFVQTSGFYIVKTSEICYFIPI
jgi:hypothetical protein